MVAVDPNPDTRRQTRLNESGAREVIRNVPADFDFDGRVAGIRMRLNLADDFSVLSRIQRCQQRHQSGNGKRGRLVMHRQRILGRVGVQTNDRFGEPADSLPTSVDGLGRIPGKNRCLTHTLMSIVVHNIHDDGIERCHRTEGEFIRHTKRQRQTSHAKAGKLGHVFSPISMTSIGCLGILRCLKSQQLKRPWEGRSCLVVSIISFCA